MEKKSIKISLWICIALIVVLAIALGVVSYFGLVQNNSKISSLENEKVELQNKATALQERIETLEENTPEKTEENKKEESKPDNNTQTKSETIPTTDLVTLYYEATEARSNVFYAYINNGSLYYFTEAKQANGTKEGAFDFISTFIASSTTKKYEGLSNVKRMKTYNVGTGIDVVPFLITEDGKVYTVNIYGENDIEVKLYEGLKDYKVEDILSHTGEEYSEFKLLLKDGSTKTVRV